MQKKKLRQTNTFNSSKKKGFSTHLGEAVLTGLNQPHKVKKHLLFMQNNKAAS